MNKKGFTLVELMSVLVIMSIILMIGTYSVQKLNSVMKKDLWTSKVNLIEKAAVKYGEDHKKVLTNSCNIDGEEKVQCKNIQVQTLIDRGYIRTKEYKKNEDGSFIVDNDENKIKTIVNETKSFGENGYYVNDNNVMVYMENNFVYAKFVE